jgi:biopolymer transport protein ExbD
MAKRRHGAKDEILLVPFLDILCSLIGVLVLIIVVLCVSQTQQTEGRTPEEIQMAQDHKRMKEELVEREKLDVVLKEKIAELEKLKVEIEEKEQRYLKFRKLLSSSKELQDQNKKIALNLQKELDDLLTEIDGLKKQQDESKKMVADLMAEMKKREVPPDKKVPPVVVQPSGSGMPETTKIYFVECATGALKVLDGWGAGDYRLSATAEVVVADVAYNHFLTEVAKDKNSLILYLIRDDGQGAFNNGAGRAEGDYKIRIGKLPIPGRGQLDLALFEKYRGKVPPPPAAAAPAKPAAADKPKA